MAMLPAYREGESGDANPYGGLFSPGTQMALYGQANAFGQNASGAAGGGFSGGPMGPSTPSAMADTAAASRAAPASLAATTGGLKAMDPITAYLLISSGIGAAGNILGGKAQAESNAKVAAMNNAAELQRQQMLTAYSQSLQDPFRQGMMQMGDLSKLDLLANAPQYQFTPQAASRGTGRYAPQQYLPSADLMNWARLMQQNVASGQNVAPDVTRGPQVYGQASALDLNDLLTNKKDPRTARGATMQPAPPGTAVRRPLPREMF